MKSRFLHALLLILVSLAPNAVASVLISIDSKNVVVGTTSASLPVRFEGGDPISALVLVLQIGDGGVVLGGEEPVRITGFDMTNSLFNPEHFDMAISPPGLDYGTVKINITPKYDFQATDIPANGLIGTILIDLSNVSELRSIPISPTGLEGDLYPYLKTKAQDSSLNNVPLTFSDGSLNVVAVPEPGVVSLGLVFGAMLLKRRRSAK